MKSEELTEVVEKVPTLSNVRIEISTKEEVVNMDKIFRKLNKKTYIFALAVFFDDTIFDDPFIYYFFLTTKREKFKVIFFF